MQPEIIQEDKQIIVCRKAAGIATQTRRIGQPDMVSMLCSYRVRRGEEPYIGVVHRLDQPVEGVMVFAKTREAAASLSAQIKKRTIGKHYYAIGVGGQYDFPRAGTLTDYVVVDKKTNYTRIAELTRKEKQCCKEEVQKAVLDYQILEEMDGLLLFDITLHTGRHHQIRVQLAHAGFPLLGDFKYGASANQKYGDQERGSGECSHIPLALCAYRLEFIHPATGKAQDIAIRPQNPCFQGLLHD